jgi:TolB-like protein
VLIAGAGGAALYFRLGRAPVVSQMPDQLAKPSERFSIVVLPFANLSGDASHDYLADVISDELTTGFSRFRDSFVISRSTAFTDPIHHGLGKVARAAPARPRVQRLRNGHSAPGRGP